MTLPHSILILAFASLLAPPAAAEKFLQQGPKLVGSGATGTPQQGRAVSTSADGNTVIVGANGDNSGAGAVWVFTRSDTTWTQQGPKLVGAGAVVSAQQGLAVALSADGNTAIVGGPFDEGLVGEGSKGAAWIFTRSSGVWTQQGPTLVGTGGSGGPSLQGYSVSLSADGNTAIVGGPYHEGLVGAAWIFTRNGGVWTQQGGALVGSDSATYTQQGEAVALSADGNTAVVGGYNDNSGIGATWVYTRSGGVWTQQGGKLIGTGADGFAAQGRSVAISGDGATIFVGGYRDGFLGATWVFTRSGGVWTQQGDKLVGSGALGSAFGGGNQGVSVSLSADGNTGIVGGFLDNSLAGAAWVFRRNGSVWRQLGSKLVGTGALDTASQGFSVAISGDGATAFVGGYADNSYIGATWVYSQVGGSPARNLVYKPLEPCRIMDTRGATLASGVQGPIAGNSLKTLPGFVTAGQNWGQYGGSAASDCGLTSPPGASISAVALVATILSPNFDAYLGIGDDGDLSTVLSNVALNYTANQGLSTMYIVPQIDSNSIYFAMPADLSAQLIYDVVGYYATEDATPMQCTTQSSSPVSIGSGASGIATSPTCSAGYTLTSGSCDSTSFTLSLTQNKASGGNTTWLCAATNRVGGAANLTATANCCHVAGK